MTTVAMSNVGAADVASNKDEIEVTLFWGKAFDKNALSTKHLPMGSRVRIGEDDGCELAVPQNALGTSALDIVECRGGEVVVNPPAGSFVFVNRLPRQAEPFVLAHGHVVDVEIGAFSIRISVGEAETKIPLALVQQESAWGTIGFSAVAHAALLAAFAFFMPSLGQADQEGIDRTQMLSMKAYLDAAAEREKDAPPPDVAAQSADSSGSNSGDTAKGSEGAMGGPKPVVVPGHWTAKGDSTPQDATLAREHALNEAREFGMIGLLNSAQVSDPNAPVVPWGSVLSGADKQSHLGNLWAGDIGDAFGTGLGLSSTGEGGGGPGEGVGIGGVGNYGHMGTCAAGEDCTGGMGRSHGRLAATYVPHPVTMRQPTSIETNGRLDPQVIQRIVRQNSGRMISCYQDGLRTNPSLSGRVSVQFVIGREGDVTLSRDSGGSDMADNNVRQCVVRSFANISFPKPTGGIVTVVYPLTFSPSDQ